MILRSVEDLKAQEGPFALAMGNFDGVHLGHQKIITSLKDQAEKSGLKSLVVTFNNHPRELITGEKVIPIITSDFKLDLLVEQGVDYVLSLDFTQEIRQMSQQDFLNHLGVDIKKLIVGHDFKFGYQGSSYDEEDIETIEVSPLILDGELISSTLVREAMTQGRVGDVHKYMGRPYRHSGKVIHGKKVGKSLGYPTTNITINDSVYALKTGVYVTRTYLVDGVYESVTNIGRVPSFDGRPFSVETHILDFNRNIYGEELRLDFLHYLREEMKFSNLEDLKARINEDVQDSRKYFRDLEEAGEG